MSIGSITNRPFVKGARRLVQCASLLALGAFSSHVLGKGCEIINTEPLRKLVRESIPPQKFDELATTIDKGFLTRFPGKYAMDWTRAADEFVKEAKAPDVVRTPVNLEPIDLPMDPLVKVPSKAQPPAIARKTSKQSAPKPVVGAVKHSSVKAPVTGGLKAKVDFIAFFYDSGRTSIKRGEKLDNLNNIIAAKYARENGIPREKLTKDDMTTINLAESFYRLGKKDSEAAKTVSKSDLLNAITGALSNIKG